MENEREEWLGSLLAYLRSFNPAGLTKLEGEPRSEVARLKEALGVELPGDYVEFLELAGRGSEDLDLSMGRDTRVSSLLALPSRSLLLPGQRLVIGIGDLEPDLALEPYHAPHPRVSYLAGSPGWVPCAESLRHFCHQRVFLRLHLNAFPHYFGMGAPRTEGLSARLRSLFDRKGFVSEWFTDRFVFCAKHSEGVVTVTEYGERQLGVLCEIACREENRLRALREEALAQSPALAEY